MVLFFFGLSLIIAGCATRQPPIKEPAPTVPDSVTLAVPPIPVPIEPEADVEYIRGTHYGGWRRVDGQCYDVRGAVLVEESLIPVTIEPTSSPSRCRVVEGQWYDPYTDQIYTSADDVEIDHFVPLKEAHRSGAYAWSDEERRAYANDLSYEHHLIAVYGSENGSKGARDPAKWLPPNTAFHCEYVAIWLTVKQRWSLTMDEAEAAAIREVLSGC
ncbi:HNH endonuclease family protein [Rhodospirillaceae bacterium SYSU D60014]|uniref:HNH endonuclease family protein n=1 Tax=Virgifigura deserti TaxID=2268457 RepID=UPI000E671363